MTNVDSFLEIPRLAVVIPCYNAAKWIAHAITSVLDQNCPNLLVVIVDDGSTDGSATCVRTFGDRVILETGPNRGACHARNLGMRLAAARGASHVLFLDADDWLEPGTLAGARDVAQQTGAEMVLSDMHIAHFDGGREERHFYNGRVAPETFFGGWLNGQYFNPSAILWKIDFVEAIGGWDESLSRTQDFDITLRAMFHAPVIVKNPEGSAIYAQRNITSISRSESRAATQSRIKVILGLLERSQGTPFEQFIPLLTAKLYTVTRTAFRTGQVDLGRQGVAALKQYGFSGHQGSRGHRILSSLVGLEAKVRLWGS